MILLVLLLTAGTVVAKRDGRPADSPADVHPLLIGAEAPSVSLSDAGGNRIDLGRLYDEQPTILVLYRGSW